MTKKTTKTTKINELAHDRRGLVRCRVCHCTQDRACANGCGWAGPGLDLCTNCATIIDMLRDWLDVAYRPSIRALLKEVRDCA